MSKLAVYTSLFALIVMTCVSPSWSLAQSQWQQSTLNTNKMSLEVGAKVFDRPGNDSSDPIVSDTITNSNLLSSDRATDFGSNFGVELKLTTPGLYDRSLEFRTVLVNWDEDNTVSGANLGSSFFADPLNTPTTFNYDIEADFYSFEVMRKLAIRPGLTVSAGPRFISTSDRLSASSLFAAAASNQVDTFEAKNSLVGLQAGLEINQPVAQAVFVTLFGRVGGFYNGTKFDSTSTTTVTTRTRRTRSTESLVAELGGRVNFIILPNCVSTFIGYEATAIDGIALSSENVFNTGRIDTRNTLFFQAITFGANFSY